MERLESAGGKIRWTIISEDCLTGSTRVNTHDPYYSLKDIGKDGHNITHDSQNLGKKQISTKGIFIRWNGKIMATWN